MTILDQLRTATVNAIKAKVDPFLRDSGYVEGPYLTGKPKKALRLVTLGQKRDKEYRTLKIGPTLSVRDYRGDAADVMGFTEYGIITDAEGGALVTQNYDDVCIEDLLKIKAKLDNFPAHQFK